MLAVQKVGIGCFEARIFWQALHPLPSRTTAIRRDLLFVEKRILLSCKGSYALKLRLFPSLRRKREHRFSLAHLLVASH